MVWHFFMPLCLTAITKTYLCIECSATILIRSARFDFPSALAPVSSGARRVERMTDYYDQIMVPSNRVLQLLRLFCNENHGGGRLGQE